MVVPSNALSKFLNDAHFVVVDGHIDPSDGRFAVAVAQFHGTAFALAPTLFLTADHVYAEASASGNQVGVGSYMSSSQTSSVVTDVERFPSVDLAILCCPALKSPAQFNFRFDPMDYLQEAGACGFPFGLTMLPGNPAVPVGILRTFRGSIVTRRGLDRLTAVPPGYETSFPAPPGLSGAPLLSLDGRPSIRGVMIGEESTSSTATTHQPMTVGVAVDIEVLLTLDSKFVGGSLAERLFERRRLPKYDGSP